MPTAAESTQRPQHHGGAYIVPHRSRARGSIDWCNAISTSAAGAGSVATIGTYAASGVRVEWCQKMPPKNPRVTKVATASFHTIRRILRMRQRIGPQKLRFQFNRQYQTIEQCSASSLATADVIVVPSSDVARSARAGTLLRRFATQSQQSGPPASSRHAQEASIGTSALARANCSWRPMIVASSSRPSRVRHSW